MSLLYVLIFVLIAAFNSGCSGPKEEPSISLALAIQRADINQLQRHIVWGTDLNQPLGDGRPALLHAAESGHIVSVQMLLKAGASVDIKDQNGRDALYLALRAGHPKVADVLLKAGMRLELESLLQGLVADGLSDRDSLAFLKDRGANFNQLIKGDTLLNQAVSRQRLEQAKQLILAGADANKADGAGLTPLQLAERLGNQDMIRLLKREGAGQ
jgi:ankyrin repeat protein